MKIKRMAILALLSALSIAISPFEIQVGFNLKIKFTFIVTMLVAANFNLGECVLYAIITDIVGFAIFPDGAFFIGYTISSILGVVIYWLFFHKKVNLTNVIISKLLVNLLVNVLLGSLWTYMLYSKAFILAVSSSIIKNLIMCPIEVIIFMIAYRCLEKFFEGMNN